MDTTKLKKANDLDRKIKELNEALNCFEWPVDEGQPKVSTNPRLIIDFDSCEGGREQIKLPMELSNQLSTWIKGEIARELKFTVMEFNEL